MKNFFSKKIFSKKRSKKSGVSFQAKPEVFHLPLHEQVPVEDIWYRADEQARVRGDYQRLLKMMQFKTLKSRLERNLFHDDTRGLENLDSDGKERSKQRHRESVAVVLSKQQTLFVEGTIDEEAIAKSYRRTCKEALEFALYMARFDEQYVLNSVRTDDIGKPDSDDLTETTVTTDDECSFGDFSESGGDIEYVVGGTTTIQAHV